MFCVKIVRAPVCGLSGGDQPQWAGAEGEGEGLPCQVLQLSDLQVSSSYIYRVEGVFQHMYIGGQIRIRIIQKFFINRFYLSVLASCLQMIAFVILARDNC